MPALMKQTEIQFPGVKLERGATTAQVAKVGDVLAVTLSYPWKEADKDNVGEIDVDDVARVCRQMGAPATFHEGHLRWSHVEVHGDVVTFGIIVDTRKAYA